MEECSEIEAGGEVRTIKDATARQSITDLTQSVNNNFARLGVRYVSPQVSISIDSPIQATFSIQNVPKGKYLVILGVTSGDGGVVNWIVRDGWVYGKVAQTGYDATVSPPFDIINHNGGNLSKTYNIQAQGTGASKKCSLILICIG